MSNIINEKNTSDYPQEITLYKPIRIIGRGSFGSLYEGIVLNGPHKGEYVAVKQVKVDKMNIKRIIWFDEGCAQFFSGEKEYEMNEGFSTWYKGMRDTINNVENINNLSHGSNFKNDLYNGYDISLLAVKNIYERIGLDGIRSLLRNSNKILEYGENVLESANLFYDIKFRSINRK